MSIVIDRTHTSRHNTSVKKNREIKYLVIHYTAGTSSQKGSAAGTARYFAQTSVQASADFIVDDGTAVQYNPDVKNRYCWHCGGPKLHTKGGSLYRKVTNENSIGIEICSTYSGKHAMAEDCPIDRNDLADLPDSDDFNEVLDSAGPNDPGWFFTDAAVTMAVKLVKELMKTYHIEASHVVRHYDVTGKLCPGIKGWNADSGSEEKWKQFKKKLT